MRALKLVTLAILVSTLHLNEPPKKEISVCKVDNSSFKAWMDYRTITDTTSKQYKIVRNSTVDENGLLTYEDCYVVALGSFYGEIGNRYSIELSSGKVIDVIKGDEKADEHTENSCNNANGSMLEYIVDIEYLNEDVKVLGDVNVLHEGNITKIYEGE